MAKKQNRDSCTTVFDGELDATDVFVSLISQKYGKQIQRSILLKRKI